LIDYWQELIEILTGLLLVMQAKPSIIQYVGGMKNGI